VEVFQWQRSERSLLFLYQGICFLPEFHIVLVANRLLQHWGGERFFFERKALDAPCKGL